MGDVYAIPHRTIEDLIIRLKQLWQWPVPRHVQEKAVQHTATCVEMDWGHWTPAVTTRHWWFGNLTAYVIWRWHLVTKCHRTCCTIFLACFLMVSRVWRACGQILFHPVYICWVGTLHWAPYCHLFAAFITFIFLLFPQLLVPMFSCSF
jgi:hypothetical protein